MTAAGANVPYGEPSDLGDVGKYWWVPFVAGVLSVIIGLVALFWPGPTLLVVGLLFGIYLAFWGGLTLVRSVMGHGAPVIARIVFGVVGLLAVVTGLVLMVRPGESVLTVVLVMGFWWVLVGVLQLVAGIAASEGRVWNMVWGVLGIIAGAIILANPDIGLITLVFIVGFGLIIQGFVEIAAAWTLRQFGREDVA
jgi:uncharacterized membrane protein HdeD (DUF308 family)